MIVPLILLQFLPMSPLAHRESFQNAEALKEKLNDAYNRRKAIHIEYHLTSTKLESEPKGSFIRREIAADREGRLFLDNGHTHDLMHWTDDPFRKTTYVTKDGFHVFQTLNRILRIYPANVGAAMPSELVFLLGWWPLLEIPEPTTIARNKLSIENLLEDELYSLTQKSEKIDGQACVVLEKAATDILHIDAENGYLIRQRQLFDHETKALAIRIQFGDFRNIEGILFPFRIKLEEFDSCATEADSRSNLINTLNFEVKKLNVNDQVDLAEFAPNWPAGTIFRNEDSVYSLIKPGEELFAVDLVNSCRRIALGKNNGQIQSNSLRTLFLAICLFFGMLSGGLAVSLIVRSRK